MVEGGSGVGEGHDYIQITVDLVGDPLIVDIYEENEQEGKLLSLPST